MNFVCASKDLDFTSLGLRKHDAGNGWYIYLDKGWTIIENYFFKGFTSSWCKIYFDPIIKIETNKLRDFPIYYSQDIVSNFQKLENVLPVDGSIQIANNIDILYKEDFYPAISQEQMSFEECHDTLFDALIENIGTFASGNNKTLYMPAQGGIDTLTIRSVFDYLRIDYKLFDLPENKPTPSLLRKKLCENYWGFTQVDELDDSVIVSGFYGDEWILRNPYYVHVLLSQRGIDLIEEFNKKKDCYMYQWFERYRNKCSIVSQITINELISQICNDFQIWHVNNTNFFSPLKHITLLNLLRADSQTIINQVTDADLSRSIIEKCNPTLLKIIDSKKNCKDPTYFWQD